MDHTMEEMKVNVYVIDGSLLGKMCIKYSFPCKEKHPPFNVF